MATIVAAAGGGNWTVGGTWVGGVAPTAADDVQLNGTSGSVTINASAVGRSLDCTGYTGTLTHTAGITLTLGDATAGAGNVALKLVAGMTYTLGSTTTSAITFASTSATQQTITTGGKTLGNWTVSGTGSSYMLADTNNANGSGATTVTLTAGTLDTGNQACNWGIFGSINSNVRTLNLGSSNITITGSWSCSTATNLTLNAGTSTITFSGASAVINGGQNISYNNLVFNGSGVVVITSTGGWGTGVIANLTRVGIAAKTEELDINTATVVTGTLTLTGNSVTNRLLVTSNVTANQRTLTVNGSVVASNTDIRDLQGAGSASWNLAAAPGGSGDCGGNTGITFTTAATQTWSGTSGGNWSTNAWTTRVPLPQDDVIISSAFSASQTIVADMPRVGKSVSWTGSTGAPAWSISSVSISIHGSLTLATGMTVTGGATMTFRGRGAGNTITSNGVSFGCLLIFAAGVSSNAYTLQDNFTTPNTLNLGSGGAILGGTLNLNGFTLTCSTMSIVGALAGSVLNFGSGAVNLTSTAAVTIWSIDALSAITAGTGTITVTTASINDRTFTGAGKVYPNLTYTVANSPGALLVTGANTFATVTAGPGRVLTLPSSTTTTVGSMVPTGANFGYAYFAARASNYLSAPNSAALQITGDIDLIAYINPATWTPNAFVTIIGKDSGVAGGRSYQLAFNNSGKKLAVYWSADNGTTSNIKASAADVLFSDGTAGWVRATITVNNGAAGNDVKFYTSSDPVGTAPDSITWTQLGSTVTTAGTTSIGSNTTQLTLGCIGTTSQLYQGALYRAVVRNGIGGTIVFDADLTAKTFGADSFTENSANAATVTFNGTQMKAGDGRLIINASTPGTTATLSKAAGAVNGSFLSLQDSTATGGASWYAGANSVNVSNNSGWFFTNYSSSSFLEFL